MCVCNVYVCININNININNVLLMCININVCDNVCVWNVL